MSANPQVKLQLKLPARCFMPCLHIVNEREKADRVWKACKLIYPKLHLEVLLYVSPNWKKGILHI
ncbi:hypothetical protein CS542_00385 [Pedobacter sp. IW39]|nr:hypothetical protein CS542_00385 [Pedobacter sp. IW39]